MKSPLQALLSWDGKKYTLRVSSFPINPISPMHQQGEPFPSTVKQTYDNQNEAIEGLKALHSYYLPSKDVKEHRRSSGVKKRGSD
jgi:hypothetical protein